MTDSPGSSDINPWEKLVSGAWLWSHGAIYGQPLLEVGVATAKFSQKGQEILCLLSHGTKCSFLQLLTVKFSGRMNQVIGI